MIDRSILQHLHEDGMSAAQIAAQLGCSERTVQRWRRLAGATPTPEHWGQPATPDRLAQAERLLDDGASFAEVVRTLGMHKRTLERHFPGRQWTREQADEHRVTCMRMRANELLRGTAA